MKVRARFHANTCGNLIDVPESAVMRRLKQASAARRRAEEREQALALEAMDAGENQAEVAAAIGKSREYLRKLRLRVRGDK